MSFMQNFVLCKPWFSSTHIQYFKYSDVIAPKIFWQYVIQLYKINLVLPNSVLFLAMFPTTQKLFPGAGRKLSNTVKS